MAKLTYTAIASLDGFVVDEDGSFAWAAPDDEVHAFVNDLQRPVGTYLYGRRMYEVMSYWETHPATGGDSAVMADYAGLWQAADKVVYSKTLKDVSTARTTLERDFDPDAVARMKKSAASELTIAGPTLAAQALGAGLVDECHLLFVPAVVGGGVPVLPPGLRLKLELLDERRFGNGTVYLRYEIAGDL